jgi:pyruvate/2-oxoglutarate/acetoin dehydrogenase E1 component
VHVLNTLCRETDHVSLHIAENGFMGMGVGAAMTGLRPIVEGMNMGFLLLAFNQISNNAGMLHYTSGGQYKVKDSSCRDTHAPLDTT